MTIENLVEAYRRALYRVSGSKSPFDLHIDPPSPELLACHQRHGVSSSAFITARNPRSVPTSGRENTIVVAGRKRFRN
jgi:hypothetical protein